MRFNMYKKCDCDYSSAKIVYKELFRLGYIKDKYIIITRHRISWSNHYEGNVKLYDISYIDNNNDRIIIASLPENKFNELYKYTMQIHGKCMDIIAFEPIEEEFVDEKYIEYDVYACTLHTYMGIF